MGKEGDPGLIFGNMLAFAWRDGEKPTRNLGQDNRCPGPRTIIVWATLLGEPSLDTQWISIRAFLWLSEMFSWLK
jgi:hypothetical protein